MKLSKKIFIDAKLELLTGLHIGDSKENVEIGGVDNPIIRRKDNQEPYIPGSSLKGKIRCLLEHVYGENADSKCKDTGSPICKLFGSSENKETKLDGNPSRLIVRDAYLTREFDKSGKLIGGSAKDLKDSEFTDMPYTEIKIENVINRIKGTAEHPRQQERIPAGADFNLHFVINIFEGDDEKKYVALLKKGLNLLEDDYLGGSGSRGYGQVKIEITEEKIKEAKEYLAL